MECCRIPSFFFYALKNIKENFLFADTIRGAKVSAIVYSIFETAKENGLNPMNYLTYLFDRMPNQDYKTILICLNCFSHGVNFLINVM